MDPFKLAAFWTGMALGIPMLATELAAEVWGTKPKPAPAPEPIKVQLVAEFTQVAPDLATLGHDLPVYLSSQDLARPSSVEVEAETYLPGAKVRTVDEAMDELAAAEAVEQAKSDHIPTRLKGQLKLAKVNARRATRKGDPKW